MHYKSMIKFELERNIEDKKVGPTDFLFLKQVLNYVALASLELAM